MSSPEASELLIVDAIVLAGSRGAKPFRINDEDVAKPFLELGGEPLVSHVVRALLGARRIGTVFVVGPVDKLEQALRPLMGTTSDRIRLVAEGDDLLDNCYRGFFQNLLPERKFEPVASPRLDPELVKDYRERFPEARKLPVLFVTSDLPFLTSQAVDRYLEIVPEDAEIAMGMANHRELERVRSALGEETALDFWKLGAMHLLEVSVRLNNMFLVRPLAVNPGLYTMLHKLYAHRWLLNRDGSLRTRNWLSMTRAMIRYSRRAGGWLRFLRGVMNFIPAVIAMFLARFTHRVGRWLSWPFRVFLRKRDMESIAYMMFSVRGYIPVSPDPGPAIDIDVEESYRSLVRDDEKEFRQILTYLKKREPAEENADPADPDLKAIAGG